MCCLCQSKTVDFILSINVLNFRIWKHKNINQIITKLFMETLLNTNIFPFKKRVVKLIFGLFSTAIDLILDEYSSSK